MGSMSPLATLLLGTVMAGWLGAAIWALITGQRMRRAGMQAQGKLDRLTTLLASAPAAPVIIHPDGRMEAADRLGKWLGRDRVPTFVSELTAPDGGLEPADAAALGREIGAAQKAGKSFSLPIRGSGSSRTLLVRGAPAGPALAANGGVVLWIFDATDSQAEIQALSATVGQLREALEALAGLVEAAPFPMWHRTPDLRLSLVNSAYVRAVDGAGAHDVIMNGTELVENVNGFSPQDAAAQALDEGNSLARIVPATIDGERRTMRVVDVPLGAAGVAGFAMDQHELEQARVEHRRLEAAQRDLLDRLSAGVARFGPDRALRFWNQPFISLFGLKQEALTDAPLFERVLDQMRDARRLPENRDFPAWRAERRDWFLSPDPLEENWLLVDGTHLRVYAQPLPDGGLLLIFEDRTEQVQLSSARDTLLRVRTATFDNLFEAIGVFSSDGRLHLWNSRFRTIWDISEEALGKHPRIDELMRAVQSRLAKPQQSNLVRELVRAATVERKQRVGSKEQHVVGEVVADMACRMPWRFDDAHRPFAESEFVAVTDGPVDTGDGCRLVARADDLAAVFLLQRQIGLDVVAVVMRGQDMGDRPSALLRRLDDRIEFRRIDCRRLARFRAVKKYAEVVTSADENFNLQ